MDSKGLQMDSSGITSGDHCDTHQMLPLPVFRYVDKLSILGPNQQI